MMRGKSATPGRMVITVLVAFAFVLYPLAAIGQTPKAPQTPGEEKIKPAPKKLMPKAPPIPAGAKSKTAGLTKIQQKPAPPKPLGIKPGVPLKTLQKPTPPKPEVDLKKQ